MMKPIFKAESIIQRDALRARLAAAQISSESPDRDMSRKVTSATVDFALEGYSAMFDGFDIYVEEANVPAALRVIEEFVREERASVLADKSPVPYWRRFYFCSIFSMMFPVVLTFLATYHLSMALRTRSRPTGTPTLVASVLMYLVGWVWTYLLLSSLIRGGVAKLAFLLGSW